MKTYFAFNRHQKKFFRKLRSNPVGLPAGEWPATPVMARWIEQPEFCRRMELILAARDFQTDFNVEAVRNLASQAFLNGDADRGRLAELIVKLTREGRRSPA